MGLRPVLMALVAAFLSTTVWAGEKTLKIAVLKFGTVNWELDTILHNGFDTRHGLRLQVQGMAGGAAAKVAFQGGQADVIVSDWLWVARQRAAGKDYVFFPYSKAVGGLLVGADNTAQTLADLDGAKIGIAGGPLDKSWLIFQAYAAKVAGMDLKSATQQVYGAPPLIFKTALDGDVDAVINYWHFSAKMEASGLRKLLDVSDAAQALGLNPDTPLLGYVIKGDLLREDPDAVQGLVAASRAAKSVLAQDDAAWERLRPMMNAKSDAEFSALKHGFRAGIPSEAPVDEAAADRMLQVLVAAGGAKLLGDATRLPAGTFLQVYP